MQANQKSKSHGGDAFPASGGGRNQRAALRLALRARATFACAAVLVAVLLCGCAGSTQAQSQNQAMAANLERAAGAAVVRDVNPNANSGDVPVQPDLEHRDARYQLCASDVIALEFPLTPEFDQTVNIQPDGFASLAGAGDVHLEGLTTEEAVAAIKKAYAGILRDPVVTVELKDFNKPYFIVSGQVNKPGKYDLRGYTSAAEAVAIAGGFNESAKHSQVLLFHRVNNEWYEVKSLDMKRILKGHDVNEDAEIRPGDMLFVPQNFISKIKRYIPSTGVGTYYELYR
jgi:polysaccharide export outer membrane protein